MEENGHMALRLLDLWKVNGLLVSRVCGLKPMLLKHLD